MDGVGLKLWRSSRGCDVLVLILVVFDVVAPAAQPHLAACGGARGEREGVEEKARVKGRAAVMEVRPRWGAAASSEAKRWECNRRTSL